MKSSLRPVLSLALLCLLPAFGALSACRGGPGQQDEADADFYGNRSDATPVIDAGPTPDPMADECSQLSQRWNDTRPVDFVPTLLFVLDAPTQDTYLSDLATEVLVSPIALSSGPYVDNSLRLLRYHLEDGALKAECLIPMDGGDSRYIGPALGSSPSRSPDGRYAKWYDADRVYTMDLATGETRTVWTDAFEAAYWAPVRDRSLILLRREFYVPWSFVLMEADGSANRDLVSGVHRLTMSPSGTYLAWAEKVGGYASFRYNVFLREVDGAETRQIATEILFDGFYWPKEERLYLRRRDAPPAYIDATDGSDLIAPEFPLDVVQRQGFTMFSPDGMHILYFGLRQGFPARQWVFDETLIGPIGFTTNVSALPSLYPDGTRVLFRYRLGFPEGRVYSDLVGGGDPTNIGPAIRAATWSPDNSRLLVLKPTEASLASPDLRSMVRIESLSSDLTFSQVTQIQWGTDSQSIYYAIESSEDQVFSRHLYRANLDSDTRELVMDHSISSYALIP